METIRKDPGYMDPTIHENRSILSLSKVYLIKEGIQYNGVIATKRWIL
ncbi:hypothetical protein [Cardinium endosymbiont of Bemisia tabaci]|nr:hypothetical protein [Cardinium endosymbiont of Bemisia tabaci]CDG49986.1 hypothetical protein CHV_c0066 [Cardinium endosymbiont cBtQ1 of Bemisia tabaci]